MRSKASSSTLAGAAYEIRKCPGAPNTSPGSTTTDSSRNSFAANSTPSSTPPPALCSFTSINIHPRGMLALSPGVFTTLAWHLSACTASSWMFFSCQLCGTLSKISGSAYCTAACGPTIKLDSFSSATRISTNRCFGSCTIIHPKHHPGTRNLFDSPPRHNNGAPMSTFSSAVERKPALVLFFMMLMSLPFSSSCCCASFPRVSNT
mmetsp:Transcript_3979/g.8738  ORF Transcript_3979/g.8738 Transcript_3979/m.8738 type:complete len:206 (-) Transcript_3979:33-650(-)